MNDREEQVLIAELGEIKEGLVRPVLALENEQFKNRGEMRLLISDGQTHTPRGNEIRSNVLNTRRELAQLNRGIRQVHDYFRKATGITGPRSTINMMLRRNAD